MEFQQSNIDGWLQSPSRIGLSVERNQNSIILLSSRNGCLGKYRSSPNQSGTSMIISQQIPQISLSFKYKQGKIATWERKKKDKHG
jgi:hypothetical protein